MTAFPFTFRQVEVFLAACETGSFARTADLLDISEAGVSSQIRSLEGKLGCALFNRQRGKVNALTQKGAEFRFGIMQIRQDINLLIRSLNQLPDKIPPVRIFVGNHLFQDCIRPNIADFHFENSDITFDFKEFPSHEKAIAAFDNGELDFVVISLRKEFAHKRLIEICDVTMSIFANAQLAARARTLGLDAIPYIMPPSHSEADQIIMRHLQAANLHSVNVAGRYSHHDIGVQMAMKGAGAIVTISSIVQNSDQAGQLEAVVDLAAYKRVIFVGDSLPQGVQDRVIRFVMEHTKMETTATLSPVAHAL